MIRRRAARGTGRLPGLRGAADERGMVLVLTLVVLLVLSMLAGASLINGMLVRSQAGSEANAAIALHAAEGGVAAGMAWLSDADNIDNYPGDPADVPDPTTISNGYTTNTGWQAWSHTLGGSFANGGHYDGTLRFKRERRDRNGDGDCCDAYPDVPVDETSEFRDGDANSCTDCPGDVVLFNAGKGGSDHCPEGPPATGSGDGCFGLSGSYYSGYSGFRGYPVVEIESVGTRGSTAVREIALFVARNHKTQVEGMITSRGIVEVSGPGAEVDGRNYNRSGSALDGDCADIPGIALDPAVALDCDLDGNGVCTGSECTGLRVYGSSCYATVTGTESWDRPLQKTPWDVLGMTEADFNAMFTKDAASTNIPQGCSANPYYLWFSKESIHFNNASGCNHYSGILVVHNEGFDPDLWEMYADSTKAACANTATCPSLGQTACFCARYKNDAANQPAVLNTNGNVSWTGIVIADQLMLINGSPSFTGAVYSMAAGGDDVATQVAGSVQLRYSCDAVAEVTKRIGYKKKIGWQRVR